MTRAALTHQFRRGRSAGLSQATSATTSVVTLAAVPIAMIVVAELLQQRAARSAIASGAGTAAVVVLGYPTLPGGRPHPIQRSRVRLGIRAMRRADARRIVFTGGAAANAFNEAHTMARLARDAGVPNDVIEIEPAATSTWQNVAYTAPLVDDVDEVIIASDPMHARRARRYWLEQRPEDAGRVFVTDVRRPFEGVWSSVPTAIVEIVRSIRARLRPGR